MVAHYPSRTEVLLLATLFLTTALAWCPAGTWQDQYGRCHTGNPPGYQQSPPNGWRPVNYGPGNPGGGNQVNWASHPGYTKYNNPGQFFNGKGSSSWLNPFKNMATIPFINVDWNMAAHIRIVHGVMASIAFIILFPFGAISAAVLPGMLGVGLHVALQMLGFLFYLIAFAMGIWMATNIRWSFFDLYQNYHPILGILIFLVIFFQPVTGALHHIGFRKHSRRGFSSYLHIWLGRIFIILGMLNGGLGLYISGNASGGQVMAYALLGGMIFVVWMIAALFGEIKRHRRDVPKRSREVTPPMGRTGI